MVIPIPPYAPTGRVNRIVPFTMHDGETYLTMLERLREYLNGVIESVNKGLTDNDEYFASEVNTLITTVNNALATHNEGLDDFKDATIADVNAIVADLNARADAWLAGSVSVGDPVVSELIESGAETRPALDAAIDVKVAASAATINAAKADVQHTHSAADIGSGVLSPARFPAATTAVAGAVELATSAEAVAGADSSRAVTPAGLTDWFAAVQPARKRAVFFGSSNVQNNVPGVTMWPVTLCNARGWTNHNYGVPGGGYLVGPDTFMVQAQRAVAGMSASDRGVVGHVFVGDASNDARTMQSYGAVYAAAKTLYGYIRQNFPNARIVVIPQIWPSDAKKYAPYTYDARWNASAVNTAMAQREALADFRNALFADESWTWLTGNDSAMDKLNDVHPGNSGNALIARYVDRVIDGEFVQGVMPWTEIVPHADYSLSNGRYSLYKRLSVMRRGWDVFMEGCAIRNVDYTSSHASVGTIPYGYRPTYAAPIFGNRWEGELVGGYAQIEIDDGGGVTLHDTFAGASRGVNVSGMYRIG